MLVALKLGGLTLSEYFIKFDGMVQYCHAYMHEEETLVGSCEEDGQIAKSNVLPNFPTVSVIPLGSLSVRKHLLMSVACVSSICSMKQSVLL